VAVTDAFGRELAPLLQKLDPKANDAFPNIYVKPTPEGVYLCDNLTNQVVASQVIRAVLDVLLRYSPSVEFIEP